MTAYSGALTRAAHFSFRPPVPGINPEHEHPEPDPDPFSPAPQAASQPGDVWQPADLPTYTAMQLADRPHWTPLEAPLPSSVPVGIAGEEATRRMLANHMHIDYRPNTYAPYKHATQGRSIEFVEGRRPGAMPAEALMMGTNSYDATNAPSEVYGGDRYRLGTQIQDFGRYEFWTKQGQDANLRGYTGLEPAFPVDKPRVPDSAPYTPNSSGTTTWTLDSFQSPSMFGLPSETAVTDYQATVDALPDQGSQFDDGGRL